MTWVGLEVESESRELAEAAAKEGPGTKIVTPETGKGMSF
jgi:hypothetical protein